MVSQYSQMMAGMEFEFRAKTAAHADEIRQIPDPERGLRGPGQDPESPQRAAGRPVDQLVHIRDRMAKKMGYRNFVELGYYRMGRLCHGRRK